MFDQIRNPEIEKPCTKDVLTPELFLTVEDAVSFFENELTYFEYENNELK